MSNENQLTEFETLDVKKIIFAKKIEYNIPGKDDKTKITYTRIPIKIKYPDNTIGDLILATPKQLFSWGVNENIDSKTGEIKGYKLPLCLYNNQGPSDEEKQFVKTIEKIIERCKQYVFENKDEFGQGEIESAREFRTLNKALYWRKDENKKILREKGPTLYAKLLAKKLKDDGGFRIISDFYDENGKDLDPFTLIGKRCIVDASIKIESIYIGTTIALQTKLYEAMVKPKEAEMKRLLRGPMKMKVAKVNTNPILNDDEDEDNEDSKEEEKSKSVEIDYGSDSEDSSPSSEVTASTTSSQPKKRNTLLVKRKKKA